MASKLYDSCNKQSGIKMYKLHAGGISLTLLPPVRHGNQWHGLVCILPYVPLFLWKYKKIYMYIFSFFLYKIEG